MPGRQLWFGQGRVGAGGVGVYGRGGQGAHLVEQVGFGVVDDAVILGRDAGDRSGGLVDQGRVYRVHQSCPDRADSRAEHSDDRRRDQADNRVGSPPVERDPAREKQYRH